MCLSALVFQLVARRMNNTTNFWQRSPNLPSQMKENIHFSPSECWIPDTFSRTGRQNKEVSRLLGTWGHWCMRSSLSVPIWGEMFLLVLARIWTAVSRKISFKPYVFKHYAKPYLLEDNKELLSLQELQNCVIYSNQAYPRLHFKDLLSKLCEARMLLISSLIRLVFQNGRFYFLWNSR